MPVLPALRWLIYKLLLPSLLPLPPKPSVTSFWTLGRILVCIPCQKAFSAFLTYSLPTEIKEWADKNGIKVPQGSKRNELLAIARKHRAQLTGDNVPYSAKSAASKANASGASAYSAATSSAGNQYAKATDDAQLKVEDAFNSAIATWSDVRTSMNIFVRKLIFCSLA
jgi:hypothetical protein